jgi:hypothetical protein
VTAEASAGNAHAALGSTEAPTVRTLPGGASEPAARYPAPGWAIRSYLSETEPEPMPMSMYPDGFALTLQVPFPLLGKTPASRVVMVA